VYNLLEKTECSLDGTPCWLGNRWHISKGHSAFSMLVIVYEFTLHNILEDLKLHQRHCEDCVFCIDYISVFLTVLWKGIILISLNMEMEPSSRAQYF
jgi:hypothetical protein